MTRTAFASAWLPILVLRVILGVVFIYAGWVKTRSPLVFADGIAAYQILPAASVSFFALALPPFEMMLGAWLLSGWRSRTAAFCAASTLLAFMGAIAAARLRGLQIDCACFGPTDPQSASSGGPLALVRDAALTAVALLLYAVSWRDTRRPARPSGGVKKNG